MNSEIQNLCMKVNLYGKDEQSVNRACNDWGDDVVLGILERMTKEQPRRKGMQKELRIAQFNRLMKERINSDKQARKQNAISAQVEQWEREWQYSQDRGFVADKKQLEDQIAEAYDSGEILNYVPRSIPPELREDPQALKAKLLEWGIKGAALVKDMVAVAKDAEPTEDDIPF